MQGLSADFVIRNGIVITVDPKYTIAQAVAVRDGIIVRVGTNEDMEPLIGRDSQSRRCR